MEGIFRTVVEFKDLVGQDSAGCGRLRGDVLRGPSAERIPAAGLGLFSSGIYIEVSP